MTATRFRAVLFDFGGTLFSYGDMRAEFDALLRELAERHGLRPSPDELRAAYREAFARTIRRYAERPFYRHRDLFGEAHRASLEALGASPGPEDAELFYRRQTEVGLAALRPRADVEECLGGLRERGLHLGIVSNIDDDQFAALWERARLGGYFDATTTSEEARSCKPHPAIFRHALEKAGGIAPEEVLFVGDSPEQDVAGARALGMRTALIDERAGAAERDPPPHHRIGALRELLGIVGA